MVPALACSPYSEVAAPLLLALDRFDKRLDVAFTEAARALPFDELEEHGRAIAHRLGEDLQKVAVLVAVHQDLVFLEILDRHADLPDPLAKLGVLVIGVRCLEELDPVVAP